jgi:hypothetical protein
VESKPVEVTNEQKKAESCVVEPAIKASPEKAPEAPIIIKKV